MFSKLRNRHFFLTDIALLSVTIYLSFILRLERFAIEPFWISFAVFCGISLFVTTFAFQITGIYSRYWRYASIEEIFLLTGVMTLASFVSTILTIVILFVLQIQNIPRSIPFINLFIGLGFIATPRLLVRFFSQRQSRKKGRPEKRVLIVGAGDAGATIAREYQHNSRLSAEVVGFIDDDVTKHESYIFGIPVLGGREDIPRLVRINRAQEVIIAIPSASGKSIRKIARICEEAKVKTKIMPGLSELLTGNVSVNQLREIQIEDLLRRSPIDTDLDAVRQLIGGKRVLVTGGGGSIGSELCRQILHAQPTELILLGHGENSIFEIHQELRTLAVSGVQISAVIGDVRFPRRINDIFQEYEPDIVFHAAAHKHVPLMEANPSEAITNNVLGTKNLLAAAMSVGVSQFVMISTDKAVNPTSVMGASKRAAELLVHDAAVQSGKPYMAVRFGNVLGSRGSVVLTFKKQIKAGGPVTVTHPDMVRFFMTIPEAVQLVLQAATLGSGGEVFMLDMGKPIKILDLARDVIELSGLKVDEDIDIVFSGMRPGEKLYEEMFIAGEDYERTKHKKIFTARNASQLLPNELKIRIETLIDKAKHDDKEVIINELKRLIPEYQPDGYRLTSGSINEEVEDIGNPLS